MAIHGAAMRKLIHIAFAILKPALSLSKGPDNPATQSMPLHEEQQDGIYRADMSWELAAGRLFDKLGTGLCSDRSRRFFTASQPFGSTFLRVVIRQVISL